MFKTAVIVLTLVGLAYVLMLYANSLWHKAAFTTGPTGAVSWAAVVLAGVAVFLFTKLTVK